MKKPLLLVSTFGNSEREFMESFKKKKDIFILFYNAERLDFYVNKKKKFTKKLFFQNNKISLLINILIIFHFIFKIVKKHKIQSIKSQGIYVTFFSSLLKKINLIKSCDYICGDWFLDQQNISHIKNFFYSRMEIFIKNNSRKIFSFYPPIKNSRLSFFKTKKILNKNNEYILPLFFTKFKSFKINKRKKNIKIGTSGVLREDFDGSVLIEISKSFIEYKKKKISYVHYGGVKNRYHYNLLNKMKIQNNKKIKLSTFIRSEKKFYNLISSIDVGYAIMKKNSYSKNVLTSKIVAFIQCGVPIVCSKTLSYAAQIIKKNNIGLITNGKREDIIKKTKIILNNKKFYKKKMDLFLKKILNNRNLFISCFID